MITATVIAWDENSLPSMLRDERGGTWDRITGWGPIGGMVPVQCRGWLAGLYIPREDTTESGHIVPAADGEWPSTRSRTALDQRTA